MTAPSTSRSGLYGSGRSAGAAAVLLAVALALAGVVLAVMQTRELSARLLTQLRQQARHIAVTTGDLLRQQLTAALRSIAYARRSGSVDPAWLAGDFPEWMDGLYAWDGKTLTVLRAPASAQDAVAEEVTRYLDTRPTEWPGDTLGVGPTLVFRVADGQPLTLAFLQATGGFGVPIVVATRILPERVRTDLVAPLLALADGLELVPAEHAGGPWLERMPGALGGWVLQPTPALVQTERWRVLARTGVSSLLTLLALLTLLGAMALLVRLARRETMLANMKANFVADVSHELKTPLALIRLFGETLQSGRVTTEDKRREYYEIITRESTRLTNLINNILDFARIDAGRKEYSFQRTDAGQVVREVYDAYRPELERQDFTHQLCIAEGLPPIRADRDALAQVLLNLISNTLKYSGEERYLRIELDRDTRRGRRGVLISVQDRGIGIRPEERAHLFEGFFRSADAQVRKQRGTGLGLAVVKYIVDAHQGTLDVESRLVKGTTFRIFLPAWQEADEAPGS
ncbi:MAG TPA: HAMP domain-containing sensor histidine kinase [Phycisphaerae bacterium]|nr:HAMP domain-containing sensor histidine kinase [Phycisphaerae bacterium]HNU44596.1 HAMP domain-containing sensor histidine kinase [Phycisphaerae bacterium]